MKKFEAVLIILIMFLCFTAFMHFAKHSNTVLNIVEPSVIQVDLNNNGIIDDNETVCIAGIESFTPDLGGLAPDFVKDLNLSPNEIISLGYLAEEFSINLLADRTVKVKLNGQKTQDCWYGDILIDNENYSEKLINSGLAAKHGIFAKEKFGRQLEVAKHLKLAILNHKSGKYHTLDCEYGVLSTDYAIIPEKQLPKDALPCKYCHLNGTQKPIEPALRAGVKNDGNISLILTDFTKNLVPNQNCSTVACRTILKEINNAQKSIDIAVYGWDNIPVLTSALKNARMRGVKIRAVYDKSTQPNYYMETDTLQELAAEYNTDFIPHNAVLTNMLMHNKFFIFDNSTVITGSMNISSTGTSDYNANAIITIKSDDAAKLYTAEFEQMLNGKFHTMKSKLNLQNIFVLGSSKISIYFSPYDNAMADIIQLINNAEKYIYMPVFLITHYDLAKALIIAKQRGVDVRIIIDANNVYTRNTKHSLLRENGILVKTENYAGKMHSKSIIIDDKYVISGSMNFSNSGVNKNDENTLIIESSGLAEFYKDFFLYLWAKIPDKWLKMNVRAESRESIGSCSDGIDNDFDGFTDDADTSCR